MNTKGSYRCDCKEGFYKAGDWCIGKYICYITTIVSVQINAHDMYISGADNGVSNPFPLQFQGDASSSRLT